MRVSQVERRWQSYASAAIDELDASSGQIETSKTYGVRANSSGVSLNMLCKWMGHASVEVTALYANALSEEQHSIAARMWKDEELSP